MGSKQPRLHYCRCGTHLARDNPGRQCARCQRESRDKLITPPRVPPEFWQTEQFRDAFAVRHMGRVARAYRTHPDHYAVYGPDGISQTLLGQWLGLRQPQVSRFETGRAIQHLDTLQHYAQVMRIPAELLWFDMPDKKRERTTAEPTATDALVEPVSNGELALSAGPPVNGVEPVTHPSDEHADDSEHDPVLVAPWNHRGTVEAVVLLSGGGVRVKRRVFISLTGPALTAPAHQWLIHEPEPLISGLSGGRVSGQLATRISAVVTELRRMDDVGGGGSVLTTAEQLFVKVARLLDQASYDEPTGRALHLVLAELAQLCGFAAYDSGEHGLAQRYYFAGLRAAHTADDRPFGAHILAYMANQATRQGRPAEAVTFIETALAGTRGRATPALLAELHIQHARAFAVMRDTSACTAAISQARTHVERLQPDDDPPWLYWLDYAWITVHAGTSLLDLGQADQAVVLFDEGIAQLSAAFVRDRQQCVTRLADARARPGKQHDLDAAVVLGMESLDLAESLNSRLISGPLHDLCLHLKPYDNFPAVRDFLERAKGFAAA